MCSGSEQDAVNNESINYLLKIREFLLEKNIDGNHARSLLKNF